MSNLDSAVLFLSSVWEEASDVSDVVLDALDHLSALASVAYRTCKAVGDDGPMNPFDGCPEAIRLLSADFENLSLSFLDKVRERISRYREVSLALKDSDGKKGTINRVHIDPEDSPEDGAKPRQPGSFPGKDLAKNGHQDFRKWLAEVHWQEEIKKPEARTYAWFPSNIPIASWH